MAQPKRQTIEINDLRGGRNNTDSPQAIGETQCVEAWDLDWFSGLLGRKRVGSYSLSLTSGPSKDIRSFVVWRSTATSVRLLSFSVNVITVEVHERAAGAWGAITIGDAAIDGNNVVGASLNGTVYLAYQTSVNRLHALDAGTTTIRRVGLLVPAAATVANTGGGAYPATLRYYKVAYAKISGAVTLERSELSPAVSFTPSGAGTAARVTKPAAISEGETHWLLYASADDRSYFLIATTVVGTTTYDDSATPSAYTGDAPQLAGTNIPPPSVKAILSDGARLVMAIPYESSAATGETAIKQNRVWFTRVLGASGIGDLESIPVTSAQTNYIDIGELNDDGPITGLGGPIDGVVYAFQTNRVWPLVPTGDGTAPYTARCLTTAVGAVNHRSIVMAEDETGQPALYFVSKRGPYRIGRNGLESLTAPVEDLFDATRASDTTVHGIYHANRRQIWWVQIPLDKTTYSILVYDVKHNAYSRFSVPTGLTFRASCVYYDSSGAVFVPYLGGKVNAGSAALARVYDDIYTLPVPTDDAGTLYRSYLTTRAYAPAGIGTNIEVKPPSLLALKTAAVVITITAIRDFGVESASGRVTLAGTGGSETRVLGVAQACALNAIGVVQFEIGDDPIEINQAIWTLDGFNAPYEVREVRGA